jgi:diguanylate cyclase (GGDEF)-like protein/PAS domain S-box-containing protein
MNTRTTTLISSGDHSPKVAQLNARLAAGPTSLTETIPLSHLEREVMQILVTQSNCTTAIEDCIRVICEQLHWSGGAFWRIDDASGALVELAGWPRSNPIRLPASGSASKLPRWVGDDPVWISTLTADELHSQLALDTWTPPSSGLFLPVRSAQGLFGILSFQCREIDTANPQLTDMLGALASTFGRFCERAQAGERLLESERRFASTLALAAIGIAHVDDSGQFLYANPQLCAMLGYAERELVGLNVKQVSHPDDANATDALRDQLRAGKFDSYKLEKRYLRKDNTTIWVALTIAPMRDITGHRICDISIVEDISARKFAEERVQYLATHDGLTGLPNRALFGQLLSAAIENARRRNGKLAVLFIDLDRFKIINDSMGHEAGDILLSQMAARFRECLRGSDVVARLGGDEFVVLLPEVAKKSQVSVVAKHLLSAAMQPVEIHGQECRVTASIGICMYPLSGQEDRDVLKNADMAMYSAKEDGKNNFQFYSAAMQTRTAGRLAIETQLRRALEREEFSVHYQAKVQVGTDTITGVEALLRWTNAELGSVSPVHFIPVAEETGLIVPIGLWVLRTSCIQNAQWLREGLPSVRVCVNLSMRQLEDPNLISDIRSALNDSGLSPDLLELELTESMIMHNAERAVRILTEVKALGVRLAIDDFGTGYSSLAQLKRFPIDTLKVDRSFIREIPGDAGDQAITEAIIAMGRTLSLTVVAEGVETWEQKDFLRQHACDEMQGFYFSTPVPAADFAALLRKHMLHGGEPHAQ